MTGASGKEDGRTQTPETQPGSSGLMEGTTEGTTETGTDPESPSKQLPDQISFFSGNPSVEIVHGIMHLYKTK